MKTARLRGILVASVAAITSIAGTSVFAQTTVSSVNFNKEKMAINKDLASIAVQQEKVRTLKQQCREEHKAGANGTSTHANLIKAKADLKRDKQYLKADRNNLWNRHQAHIERHRDAVMEERAELRKAERQLDKDLAKGNASAVKQAQLVVDNKYELRKHEAKLEQALDDREADMTAVNQQLRNANSGDTVSLAFEPNGNVKEQREKEKQSAKAQNGSGRSQSLVLK